MAKFPMRIHEYLEIVEKPEGQKVIRCIKCGYEFCDARENYKRYALYRERDLSDVKLRSLSSGEPTVVVYQEYICPGCATLLQVDTLCPELEEDPIIWDIQIKID